jgi:hypothetical protein
VTDERERRERVVLAARRWQSIGGALAVMSGIVLAGWLAMILLWDPISPFNLLFGIAWVALGPMALMLLFHACCAPEPCAGEPRLQYLAVFAIAVAAIDTLLVIADSPGAPWLPLVAIACTTAAGLVVRAMARPLQSFS